MFEGLRVRGGISGTKQDPHQPIGVDWAQLKALRRSYEDKVKGEIDTTLTKVCSSYRLRVSHSNVGGHHSISVCHENDTSGVYDKKLSVVRSVLSQIDLNKEEQLPSLPPLKEGIPMTNNNPPNNSRPNSRGVNIPSTYFRSGTSPRIAIGTAPQPSAPPHSSRTLCSDTLPCPPSSPPSNIPDHTSPPPSRKSSRTKKPNFSNLSDLPSLPSLPPLPPSPPRKSPPKPNLTGPPPHSPSPSPPRSPSPSSPHSLPPLPPHQNHQLTPLEDNSPHQQQQETTTTNTNITKTIPFSFTPPTSTHQLDSTYIIRSPHLPHYSKHPRPPSAEDCPDFPQLKVQNILDNNDIPTAAVIENERVETCFEVGRNSPVKAVEAHEMRTQLLKKKINKKLLKEEVRKKELEAKKEKERLERIQRREERIRKVAENRAALEREKIEKNKRIEANKEETAANKYGKDLGKGEKLKLRHQAAEQRRKEKEMQRLQKQREIDEEKKIQEELHRKRMEMKEEMRLQKQMEKKIEHPKMNPVLKLTKTSTENIPSSSSSSNSTDKQSPSSSTVSSSSNNKETVKPYNIPPPISTSYTSKGAPSNTKEPPCTTNTYTSTTKLPPDTNTAPLSKSNTTTAALLTSSTTFIINNSNTIPPPSNSSSTTVSSSSCSEPLVTTVSSSKYADVPSYEITPISQDPLRMADNNYDIAQLSSGDSSDDEDCPKKTVPMWASSVNLNRILSEQEYTIDHNKDFNVEKIFPPEELLQSPDLQKIFRRAKKRYFKRTSSAQWTSPILKKTRTITKS